MSDAEENKKENWFKYISRKCEGEGEYKFWGEMAKLTLTGIALAFLTYYFQQKTSDQQESDNKLKYEQELVNKYMEDVKGLLLNEYHNSNKVVAPDGSNKVVDPEITHADIANFVSSKTSSLLKTITEPEQRQRLINFLKYSSIATIPEYRYPLYYPDNICSRVSRVKSKYYSDFLCTLNLTSDQKIDNSKEKNVDKYKLSCPITDRKNRTNLAKIVMSDMILEKVDFRRAILEISLFDRAQLDHAVFDDALLYKSSFNNTDLQYADMNCAQLKGAIFSNAFMKGVTLSNADLSEAELLGSNLRDANLSHANLSSTYLGIDKESDENNTPTRNITDLRGADLSGANLAGAKLIKVDLRRAKLEEIKYPNFHIYGNIKDFYFSGNFILKVIKCENSIIDITSYLKLPKDFIQACPLRVITSNKEATKAKDDKKTDIDLSDLSNSNLSGFDLSGEDLQDAKLRGADLRKTDLRGTDLRGIKFNSDTNFEDAIYDKTTFLPDKLKDLLKEIKDLPKEELKDLLEKLKELKYLPKEELKEDFPKEKLKDLLEKLKKLKDLPKEELKEDFPKEKLKELLENLKNLPNEELKEDLSKEQKEKLPSLLKLLKILVFNSLVEITDYDKVPQETLPNKTDLSFIDLQYVNLSKSKLTGVDLLISNLSYARLVEAILIKTVLEKANLTRANLEHADLTDAILKGANLIEANLSYATLTNADLQEALLIRTDLRGAKLSQAILERLPKLDDAIYNDKTELPFSDKKAKDYGMWKIAPGSDLKGAILRGVDLRDENLDNAVIDDQTRLDGALFNQGTKFPDKIEFKLKDRKKIYQKAQDEYNMVFIPANTGNEKIVICPDPNNPSNECTVVKLRLANLQGVEFTDSNLTDADLTGANLRGTYWKEGIILKGAKFISADLRNATFEKVDLSGVDFTKADLRGADLSRAEHLSPEKLKNICYDKLTKFPLGIEPTLEGGCEK